MVFWNDLNQPGEMGVFESIHIPFNFKEFLSYKNAEFNTRNELMKNSIDARKLFNEFFAKLFCPPPPFEGAYFRA